MKRLTLVRHGNAAWKDLKAADFDRPITRTGQLETAVLAKALLRAKLTPDLLVSSAAQRARQTTEILARELAIPHNSIRYDEQLYLAEAPQILRVAQANGPKLNHLMIVGHNPCITELAQLLAARTKVAELQTATAFTMTFDVSEWLEIGPSTAVDSHLEPAGQALPAIWP